MHYCGLLLGLVRSETFFTLKVKGSDAAMLVSNGNCCPASDSPRKKPLFHTLLIIVVESITESREHLPSLHLEVFWWAQSFTTLKIRTENLSLIPLYKKWDLWLPNISCVSAMDIIIPTPSGERDNSRVARVSPTFSPLLSHMTAPNYSCEHLFPFTRELISLHD